MLQRSNGAFFALRGGAAPSPAPPPAGHSSCREENEVDNCPSRGLVNVHADVSAYQRAKSDGGAAAAVTCPCLISVAAWRRRARPDAPLAGASAPAADTVGEQTIAEPPETKM